MCIRDSPGTPGIFVAELPVPGVYLSAPTELTEVSGTGIEFVPDHTEVSSTVIEAVPNHTKVSGIGIEAVPKIFSSAKCTHEAHTTFSY